MHAGFLVVTWISHHHLCSPTCAGSLQDAHLEPFALPAKLAKASAGRARIRPSVCHALSSGALVVDGLRCGALKEGPPNPS
eukprot:scaffold60459_cov31-Tisochrysis_lutea.AAC.6